MPFCGHATIALGAALALAHGDGTFTLQLNDSRITVTGWRKNPALMAALQSPPTRSAQAPQELVEAALGLFSYTVADLDPRLPPAIAEAGARHLVLALGPAGKSWPRCTMTWSDGRRFMYGSRDRHHQPRPRGNRTRSSTPVIHSQQAASTRTPRREPRRRPSQDICGILDGLMVVRSIFFRARTWVCRRGYAPRSPLNPVRAFGVRGGPADVADGSSA